MKGYLSILFMLSLFSSLVSAMPMAKHSDDIGSSHCYFEVQIKTPNDKMLSGRYYMDMKDGTMGFGRPGAKKFEAYINGTEQGNSYLITRDDGFGFLLEDAAPRYDFRYNFVIPQTDFKAYWAVINGVLTCHKLTDGFKYFPAPNGGYIIRWDTRDDQGSAMFMQVGWCGLD